MQLSMANLVRSRDQVPVSRYQCIMACLDMVLPLIHKHYCIPTAALAAKEECVKSMMASASLLVCSLWLSGCANI